MIKLTSPPRIKWVDGRPTSETYVVEAWVNPRFVISVDWDNPTDKKHAVVTVQDAMIKRYDDERKPSTIVELIKHDLKQYLYEKSTNEAELI